MIGTFTKQRTFTGVGVIEQQFTVTDSLLFSTVLVPLSENLGAAALIVFLVLVVKFYARRKNWKEDTYRSFILIGIPLATGTYGVLNHLLRYKAIELNLMVVGLFWGLGGLITVLAGIFNPFWVAHITNNLVYDLNRFTSNEMVLVYVTSTVIILGGLYYFLYRGRLFGKKGGS
jgi:hypothetical protein